MSEYHDGVKKLFLTPRFATIVDSL